MRRCQRCGERLQATQPSEEDYIRTLLTCPNPDCGRWYLRIELPCGRTTVSELRVPTLVQLGVLLEPAPEPVPAA